jgi:transketolase
LLKYTIKISDNLKKEVISVEEKAIRQSYGEALVELGEKNKDVVVLDADLAEATKTKLFAKKYPNRFFDMGIAEQNMMSTASGMATCGKIPYVSTFAVFATGRAYDQIRNSICYPNLNVKICATHSGITVGEDGATHQMLEDISLMRTLPNMTVITTSDELETKWAVEEISKIKGPVYLRLSRIARPAIYSNTQKFEIGKAIQIGEGTDASVFATGVTVYEAIKAKEELEKLGINIRVIDMHTIKPIDEEIIIKSAKETKNLISVEDHSIIGGLGSAISEVLTSKYPYKLERMGVCDVFGKSGKATELMEYFKIDSKAIVEKVKKLLQKAN